MSKTLTNTLALQGVHSAQETIICMYWCYCICMLSIDVLHTYSFDTNKQKSGKLLIWIHLLRQVFQVPGLGKDTCSTLVQTL